MPVLSRVQQNDIYKIAEAAGLNPLDFDWTSANPRSARGLTETIQHHPTQSHFAFSLADAKIWLSWWPNFRPGESLFFAEAWNDAARLVHLWIAEVKRNHDALDLWSEALKARQLTDAAGDVGAQNTPFTPAELELVKPKLDEVEHTSHLDSHSTTNSGVLSEAAFNICWMLPSAAWDASTG